ncbi:MAG: anthranilate synthase component I family protein [Thermoanaerobaculia bacterium]
MNRDSLLDLIRGTGAALLDGWSDSGRWTIALPDPVDEFRVEWGEEERLDEFLRAIRFESGPSPASEVPFLSGWIGFISYEVGSLWEGAPRRVLGPPELAAHFFRHETGIAVAPDGQVLELEAGKVRRTGPVTGLDPLLLSLRVQDFATTPRRERQKGSRPAPPVRVPGRRTAAGVNAPAQAGLRDPEGKRIAAEGRGPFAEPALGPGRRPDLGDSLAGAEYERAHEEIRSGISRGDYYQVNLTRRFTQDVASRADPRDLYRMLAGPDPPAYSALIRAGGADVISASPELFLRADWTNGRVETRPIKGTAIRDPDPDADRLSAAALLASAKDRAENVMIVDLCRNDLGRVCELGTVRVSELCRVRSHRLHHLESTVEGRLRGGITEADLFRAAFPPGSVTGAPKRAAVGAISRLEPVARGVYTGAIGYFDDRGRLAFNVAIRTAVSTEREVRYHAGGGITWDSRAESENRESEWKAREFFSLLASLRGEC